MCMDRYFHVKLRRLQKLNLKPRYAAILSLIIIVSTFLINANLFFTIKSNLPDSSSVACHLFEGLITWQRVGKYIFKIIHFFISTLLQFLGSCYFIQLRTLWINCFIQHIIIVSHICNRENIDFRCQSSQSQI